jgi:hypothetical protein
MTESLRDLSDSVLVLGIFLATVVVAFLSLQLGFRLGRTYEPPKREQEALARTMVGAAVGLLTFMLVYTLSYGNPKSSS